jgi:hypothetical protein
MAKKKKPTKEEREYMAEVAALGCYVYRNHLECRGYCGGRINVHHKTGAGGALRASHYDTMPLCFNHHDAQTPLPFGNSVHKGTKSFEKIYGTQEEMISWTRKQILNNKDVE